MDERTEEAGLSGLLTITVGGKPVELPVLTIEQSEAWQRKLGVVLGQVEVPDANTDGAAMLGNMLVSGSQAKLDVVLAYDLEGRLGGPTVRSRMSQRELNDAVERMVDAESPLPGIGRSVVEAFGLQTQMVGIGLRTVRDTAASFQPGSSTNGHSATGDSTPALSVVASPTSSSSFSGATARSGRSAKVTKPK